MRVRGALKKLGATTLVASAACGSDLLALAAARDSDVRSWRVHSYHDREDWFLVDSVIDRPGAWANLYQYVVHAARNDGNLIILGEPRGSDDSYRAANDTILIEAQRLARLSRPENPACALGGLIIWEGESRGPEDVTADMRQRLEDGGRDYCHSPHPKGV